MSSFWRRRPFSNREDTQAEERGAPSDSDPSELVAGDTYYVGDKAGNSAETSYQDASGAPVEKVSPLGYSVGPMTIALLNISKIVGTGIFTTPSNILSGTGSIGLSLIWWALGFVTTITAFAVYLEFLSYFPSRSGAEVVYLEQAFPRPRWLFGTAFAFQAVFMSFSSGNAYVMAQYIFKMSDHSPTEWQLKGVAVAAYTLVVLFVLLHNRFSYMVINGLGIVKIATLLFISITGFVVLGGRTKIENPTANFHNAFEGKATAYGITNALYKIIFSFAGYENAFNVANEIRDPVRQIRRNGFIAIWVVTILYLFTVIAYYSAATKQEIIGSKLTVASLFFTKVFGSEASKGLNLLIVLSAFGNMLSVLLGTSRIIRECGRQGVLPFPKFWVSTWPFGTTLGPYLSKYVITLIMILAPPAGDAFNFVTDLRIYPSSFFDLLMSVGLLIVRHRRKKLDLPRPQFRAWDVVVYFNILKNLYLLVMPWYPPAGGAKGGDVSFWYATYVVASIGILLGCGVYHWLWIIALPSLRGYKIRQEVFALEDGSSSHRLIRVPIAELEEWDRTHDHSGRTIIDGSSTPDNQEKSSVDVNTAPVKTLG
ncbi:High-affinity methionine permease [Cladobotryum mycophilum]|uniref:High-affinity methionine permease n=1 Tax=Cladobotryum mycophilum TaxID=491253 RepID=A0ABR0SPL6_9HYPO